MRKWFMACCLLSLLSACAEKAPLAIAANIYPNLPDVPDLPPLDLRPVIVEQPTSDSFVGFNYTNWSNLQINLQTLKQRELLYRQRIQEINTQRQEWHSKNK